jgi:hypothetical protein
MNRGIPVCLFVAASLGIAARPASAGDPPVWGPAKVVEVLGGIESSMKTSRYQHNTSVRAAAGEYHFDCSGMAEWVLRRSAPMALRALGQPQGRRPLARHYYNHLKRIPLGGTRGAWYRVPSAASAAPGDIITWERPPWFQSKSTGHVAFVVSVARPATKGVKGVLLRVADASRFRHQDDTRAEGQTGFGAGVILLATDDRGQAVGYGWYGELTPWDWIIPVDIAVGRPLR